ncbi:calcium channel protein, partial [Haplosporangium sp. Z 27]
MQPTSVVPVDVNSANVDIVINESLLEPDQADPGSGYTSLNQNEDNHNRGLSPNNARGSAWTSLERRTSTPSAQDFELEPINDRTGLTSVSFLPLSQQEDDTLTGGDASDNVYLQPPRRGFHNNPSNISSSSRSTGHSSRMSSVKLALGALGRASTRVINLSGSSQSQPAAIENASVYSGRSMEATGEMRDEQLKQNRASTDNFDGASRTSFSRIVREEPIDLGPPPLQGKSLFIFGPDSPLRKMINSFLNQKWVELFLLLLIMINLVFLMIKTSSPVGNDNVWGSNWTDYGIMAIFILYTLEIAGRIIVCGLIFYPEDGDKVRKFFGKKPRTDNLHDTNPTILRRTHEGLKRPPTMAPMNTFSNKNQPFPMHNAPGGRATTILGYATGRPINQNIPEYLDSLIAFTPQFVVEKAQIPYLRHTFNRIDLLAVVCYWIDVCLMLTGVAQAHDIYFFKAMAAMRTLRLLNITPGSSTILHSLKRSAPLLANIFLFIVFFFIIFSIIGVQAFKGSFSRRCISREPPHNVTLDQFCGGYIDITTNEQISYITLQNTTSPTDPKGYICPIDFICQDTGVNLHNTISFDTIYSAMVPVYVLMTGQTWTDLMYRMMDAEYKWSSLYFVLVVLVMNFWILNLFIAVINEMFAKIRDDSANKSAFKSESPEKTAEKMEKAEQVEKAELEEAEEMEESGISGEQGAKEIEVDILTQSVHNFKYRPNNPDNPDNPDSVISRKKTLIERLEMFWVLAVIGDLVVQCLPQYDSPTYKIALYNNIEFWFTIAFAFDIVSRFLIWIKTPSEFFKSKKNMVDLFLAIVTVIIQVPSIHNSHVYIYLTVFQVVRMYRPIIYIHRLRSLIQRVVGSWVGLLNLIFFIALFIAIVSVMDALLFREIMLSQADSNNPPDMTFQDYYVSYLGTYQ